MKAFPQKYPIDPDEPHHWKHNPLDTGMDLRDYFASKAMPALIGAEIEASKFFKDDRPWEWFDIDMDNDSLRDLAQRSYDLADAMMEARNDNK
jgi:hypothetical protein